MSSYLSRGYDDRKAQSLFFKASGVGGKKQWRKYLDTLNNSFDASAKVGPMARSLLGEGRDPGGLLS